jgi:DtxR family Mn-dependent transcriptional regulator
MSSPSIEDYVKAIYKSQAEGEITSQDVAARVGVSAPAVSKMLRNLVLLKLVRMHARTGVHLTPYGQRTALQTIRRHRLLEVYLVKELGYKWDEVHAEAERLEHHISPLFEERIAEKLGHPAFDPHGDPIPTSDGEMPAIEDVQLASAPCPSHLVITRLSDRDPDLLRHAAGLGLTPGTQIELHHKEPFGGPYAINIGSKKIQLAPEAACQIFGRVIE